MRRRVRPVRLGLMSDTHDDRARTERAIAIFEERAVEAIGHLGDVTSPAIVEMLDGWEAWICRGNMDKRWSPVVEAAERADPPIDCGDAFELELGGARIGLIHGHEATRLESMVAAGGFDLVCHGHTHSFRDERVGGTRVVNPGALHRASTPSVCIYETAGDALERVEL